MVWVKTHDPIGKITKEKMSGGIIEVVKHSCSKHKTLSSDPTAKIIKIK
jgi:DNA-directed RNA polymerase subunit H (RpoH/RPB5)